MARGAWAHPAALRQSPVKGFQRKPGLRASKSKKNQPLGSHANM
jgi:hypothetical protein